MVKREQDEAYRLSLEADRKKVHGRGWGWAEGGHFVVFDRDEGQHASQQSGYETRAQPTACCCNF